MKTYQKRLDEEIEKFAKKYNIEYEDVEKFALWLEWFAKQDERLKIIQDIKKNY